MSLRTDKPLQGRFLTVTKEADKSIYVITAPEFVLSRLLRLNLEGVELPANAADRIAGMSDCNMLFNTHPYMVRPENVASGVSASPSFSPSGPECKIPAKYTHIEKLS